MRRGAWTMTVLLLCASFPARAALMTVGLDKTQYTTDFMIGNVAVAVIFPESDGSIDPSTENWSDDRKAQVLSKIMSGLDWWTKQNPRSPLHFTFVTENVPTHYEPITRPYYDESLWIPDVMTRLGYPGSRFTATRNYANDLRQRLGTDWAFVIFVVDSLNDTNGKFADGLFAYSYLGGPFTVMTYDNNGYGISNMDVVVAHETGHIFHALDEYAGASGPNDYSSGYFVTINGNHEYSAIANTPNSIMRGGLRWGLDDWARQAIGWRDADGNGRDDILDQSPTIHTTVQMLGSGDSQVTGSAMLNVLPRQANAQGSGFTVDTIAKVEYRIANGQWAEARAADGTFDSASENFIVDLTPAATSGIQSFKAQDIQVQVVTAMASQSSNTGGTGGAVVAANGTPATLDDAHPFPNPFKPNSGVNHTAITFTGLTAGAKVQVFTPAGETVYEQTAASPPVSISWDAINKDGQALASGVYFFLITDADGHKKEGKLAIIR